jgi:hypothetical protein
MVYTLEQGEGMIIFQHVNLPLPTPFHFVTRIFHVSLKMYPDIFFPKICSSYEYGVVIHFPTFLSKYLLSFRQNIFYACNDETEIWRMIMNN